MNFTPWLHETQGIGVRPRAYSSAKRSITLVAEAALIIEHIMGDAEPLGDRLGVVDVLAGAAGPRAPDRLAMIVELERHSDHLGAAARGERGHDRAVDAARHGDDDPGLLAGRPSWKSASIAARR